MPYVKRCKTCEVEYHYNQESELGQFFYKKNTKTGSYYLNECKECSKVAYRAGYAAGKYKKTLDRDSAYQREYQFGYH